jgi:glutamine---fructose-6-phosphate transaminase (isomerizing)
MTDKRVEEQTGGPAPFAHWMLREIHEQPDTLQRTLDAAVANGSFHAEREGELGAWLGAAREVLILASGSSRHAGQVAELWMEDLAGLPVDVEYASEYIYRSERALKDASVLVVSQSGETADTLAALRRARSLGHATLAVTNVVASSMAREASLSFPVEAGRERAVPATKSFTGQLLNLYMLSLLAARTRGALEEQQFSANLRALAELPTLVAQQLNDWEQSAREFAEVYAGAQSYLFLGRGPHYPIAREGALKLKESSYLHAEGYPSGELKHGPNALVSDATPLVMLATVDAADEGSRERYERVVALMRDMREQGARILAIANRGDDRVRSLAAHTFEVQPAPEPLQVISEVIPLQLFAYFVAVAHGIDVDHPRNLSKAVLAE